MPVQMADVVAAVRGWGIPGTAAGAIAGFSIDTRTLRAGDLYFAIRGERFDGHAFVADAAARGAVGAVVDAAGEAVARAGLARVGCGLPLIVVADTVRALQDLATTVRRRAHATVVAISGSAGKTTTKEAAAALLVGRYVVLKNSGNLNNHIGLPLSLLELRRGADVAVMELGMNHAGEIRRLVEIARPGVRVWTNVAEVHTEFFDSLDAVADAKAEIMTDAGPTDTLIVNADDPLVMARARTFPGRVKTFGLSPAAEVRAEGLVDRALDGTVWRLVMATGSAEVRLPLLGRGNVYNVLAAAAVAELLGVPVEEVATRAATLRSAPHRGEVIRLRDEIVVIDDSYNSNPRALTGVLDVLGRARGRRKIAVLGEMLELGPQAEALHAACGRAAAAAGVALLMAIGRGPAAAFLAGASASNPPPDRLVLADDSTLAAQIVAAAVAPGDTILVKGSRGIRTEVVVERLKTTFAPGPPPARPVGG